MKRLKKGIDKTGIWWYNTDMIDISHLEQYKENNRIEAKEAMGGLPRSIWETYSAFANTSGGVILLGVTERKKDKSLHPVDLPDPQRLIAQFWELVNNKRVVNINILKKSDITVEVVQGKEIVVIAVPEALRSQKPVYIGGNPWTGTYYRDGEADIRCSEARVQRMIRAAKGE